VKTLAKLFGGIAVFAAVVATVYWFVDVSEEEGRVLLISWCVMAATIFGFLAYHGALRDRAVSDADDPGATPASAAGRQIGAFPFSSLWPIVFVGGIVVVGAALIYGMLLLPVGVAVVTIAVLGLMRESRA
jgi:hypothetical protein